MDSFKDTPGPLEVEAALVRLLCLKKTQGNNTH